MITSHTLILMYKLKLLRSILNEYPVMLLSKFDLCKTLVNNIYQFIENFDTIFFPKTLI